MDIRHVEEFMRCVAESETKTFPAKGKLKVGLDLGTAYIVIVVLDEENQPVACEKQAASVLRDGVVVDYTGALSIVRTLKEKLEKRLGRELTNCAIAMPAGTESSTKTHCYIAEGAGFEVSAVLDEPSSANAVYEIQLRNASGHLDAVSQVNEQTKKMAQQIEELNNIYARMIEAMTTTMSRPQI